jgi:hypothetical protein
VTSRAITTTAMSVALRVCGRNGLNPIPAW